MYEGLDIVSNKVTEEEIQGVPHHLLGCVPPTREFSVVDFRDVVVPLIERLRGAGKVPILVGGTHYYIEAALMGRLVDDGAAAQSPPAADVETAALASILDELDTAACYAELVKVDPVMANRLHPNDDRKVRRSLSIFHQYGRPHSDLIAQQTSDRLRFKPACCFWIRAEQAVLDARLDRRVDAMLEAGLMNELVGFHEQLLRDRPPALVRMAPPGDGGEVAASAPDEPPAEASVRTGAALVASGRATIDYSRGILQAIGFKEFEPLLSLLHTRMLATPGCDSLRAARALAEGERERTRRRRLEAEGLELMKQRTRRYARKQTAWVQNRLMRETDGLILYTVDSSDVTRWDEAVLQPAVERLRLLLDGTPAAGEPLSPATSNAERLAAWQKHHCEDCDRTLNGQHEWEVGYVAR